jgi:RNA polymerase sigma-70 factor (ECF subfamily)
MEFKTSQDIRTMPDNETELLQRAHKYDIKTLAWVYDNYSPAIYRYAFRLLGSDQNAEDCVADTFLKLLVALDKRRGPKENLKAYLFRSAHNWVVDYYRRKSTNESELQDEQPGILEGVETTTEKRLRIEEAMKSMGKLTREQREVLYLRYGEGFQNEMIAKIMKKPCGAIKSLLHRGTAALRRDLKNETQD